MDERWFVCPACGFRRMSEPAVTGDGQSLSFYVCPSCLIEFGFDEADSGGCYKDWRAKWIIDGTPFRGASVGINEPSDWCPSEQLQNLLAGTYRLEPLELEVPEATAAHDWLVSRGMREVEFLSELRDGIPRGHLSALVDALCPAFTRLESGDRGLLLVRVLYRILWLARH
jgi:hypothetical protein